tara:strand:- start:102 stop:1115 length:1014 start_codon:yes stop_codon:yes gene_type:complete
MIKLDKKISAFVKLGEYLRRENVDSKLCNLIIKTENNNGWFTFKNSLHALKVWGNTLRKENILKWIHKYKLVNKNIKQVGIIMAGNIPIVGFHDLMCVLFTNHIAIVKTSSSDPYLIPFLYNKLVEFESGLAEKAIFKNKIDFVDAIIGTGNSITIKNINEKFQFCPSILRGPRNSIAIIDGKETEEELKLLSNDIFEYFGFGCRSITKIYVPINYDFSLLKKILKEKTESISLIDYVNSFRKNKAINEIIKNKFHIAGKLILIEDKNIHAEISSVNYEYYPNMDWVSKEIKSNSKNIQCIVRRKNRDSSIKFGEAQKPTLWTYADNIDTVDFLSSL